MQTRPPVEMDVEDGDESPDFSLFLMTSPPSMTRITALHPLSLMPLSTMRCWSDRRSSIFSNPSSVPDEQQTQQDPPVEMDGEDENDSPDFVAFPDDQSSAHDEDHRSASPESHAAFDYEMFTNIEAVGPCSVFYLHHCAIHRMFCSLSIVRRS